MVKRALGSAQIPSKLKPSRLNYEKRTRPDGVTQFAWANGRSLAWDVTCVDTLAKSHLPRTTAGAGFAAEDAEREKNKKYAHLADQYIFYPIGFETIGSWGPSARDIIQQISTPENNGQWSSYDKTSAFRSRCGTQLQSWERSIRQLI